jgi:replicative DNA helicase
MEESQYQEMGNRPKTLKKIKNQDVDMEALSYGKVMPQALELERAVLGAIMLDRDAISIVLEIISPESFYLNAHQKIFNSMLKIFDQQRGIDLLTVNEQLKLEGTLNEVGGTPYLVELTNRVVSAANIEFHARILSQKHIQRELIRVSTQVIKDAFDETIDVFDLLDSAEQGLFDITQSNMNRGMQPLDKLLVDAQKQIEAMSNREEGLIGVPSGFKTLDQLTSGWQSSDLVIVAARPSMGKTAFTLNLAKNAAYYGKPVAFFSLEMSDIQITQRLLSMEAELPSDKFRNGNLEPHEWTQLAAGIERLSKYKIFVDDTPAINIFEMRAKCRRLKKQHDIQLVIVDYLQLMSGSGSDSNNSSNRVQEISNISRGLKGMAKELNIPVIALSQLSRAVETRNSNDKRPQLSDLRESGAIEQDADIVSFIYRPEYYGFTEDDDGRSLKGVTEYIIAKHRNGELKTVFLKFIANHGRFEEHKFNGGNELFGSGGFDPGDFDSPIIKKSSKINDEDDFFDI